MTMSMYPALQSLTTKLESRCVKDEMITMCSYVLLCYQTYEKIIQEIQEQLDDLDKKISAQNKANQMLDTKAADLNVEVNEKQLLRNLEFESRHTEDAKQR